MPRVRGVAVEQHSSAGLDGFGLAAFWNRAATAPLIKPLPECCHNPVPQLETSTLCMHVPSTQHKLGNDLGSRASAIAPGRLEACMTVLLEEIIQCTCLLGWACNRTASKSFLSCCQLPESAPACTSITAQTNMTAFPRPITLQTRSQVRQEVLTALTCMCRMMLSPSKTRLRVRWSTQRGLRPASSRNGAGSPSACTISHHSTRLRPGPVGITNIGI